MKATSSTIAVVAASVTLVGGAVLLDSRTPEPAPIEDFSQERGFTLDSTKVKRVIYKEGMTEAIVEYYGEDGDTLSEVIPFSWKDSSARKAFEAKVSDTFEEKVRPLKHKP